MLERGKTKTLSLFRNKQSTKKNLHFFKTLVWVACAAPLVTSISDVAKKFYFDTPKAYFIILPHHFTISHLSDVLSFNSIY